MSRPRSPSPPLDASVIQKAVAAMRSSLSDQEFLSFEVAQDDYRGADYFADLVARETRLIRQAGEPGRAGRKVAQR